MAYALPLVLCSHFPGADLPWHAAAAEVFHRDDPGRFLNYFEVDVRMSSYLLMYALLDLTASVVGDIAVAMQIVIAGYVVSFVFGARMLLESFGKTGLLAVLAAPAAYSLALEYGFLSYAIAYPLTFVLWAQCRYVGGGEVSSWRLVLLFVTAAALALTHPFAALIAAGGAVVLLLIDARRGSINYSVLAGIAIVVGMAPAVLAASGLQPMAIAPLPEGIATGGLWGRITYQVFTGPVEAVADAPARLFGFVPGWWRYALVGLGLVSVGIARYVGPRAVGLGRGSPRAGGILILCLVVVYLLTPFDFYWPRFWYVVQPRHLPLIWVVALCALGPAEGARLRALAAPIVVCVAALLVWLISSWLPFASESRDFRDVVSASAEGVRTLVLSEGPPTRDREPPSPFRHFGAYVLVHRGGFVSNLPMTTGYTGALIPVRLAQDAPPVPAGTPLGQIRRFRWDRHAAGWDQILIRDLDPDEPFDYFRDHADEMELVRQVGRWRLYSRRAR